MEHLGAPHTEFVARFNGGFGAAFEHLAAGRIDVLFGRSVLPGRKFPDVQFVRRLIRLEPLALLLPGERGQRALHAAADELTMTEHRREPPPGAWLAEADAETFTLADP